MPRVSTLTFSKRKDLGFVVPSNPHLDKVLVVYFLNSIRVAKGQHVRPYPNYFAVPLMQLRYRHPVLRSTKIPSSPNVREGS